MKVRDPKLRLTWGGQVSLEQALRLLNEFGCVELELPAEFHHAVFTHLHPHSWETQLEQVDEEGGIELLERIAEIDQLSELLILRDAVAARSPHVSVRSPAPHVTVCV